MKGEGTVKKVASDDVGTDPGRVGEDATEQDRQAPQKEIGGRDGPDPTRYGDWEKAGRCIDF